ncbi:recombinase family protein [Ralstonia insidiosa]|uniref:Recombinase family protein n=1 Tax=Ralstonia insidiosa TaxID=190721 RepID=A0A848P986_9RALS|nr:recombinase family protein [Ralstonia insidiosa]MDE4928719.1 recombinase family protein [Ralstonia insidiosa]NMV41194.1 recombinase family protein [Ralstonia insidiosa]
MPAYFAYLRVSRDSQDVANQRLWLLDYANAKGFTPLTMVEETASRSIPWRERLIGKLLLERTQPGDFILTSEFTRLGGSPGQVFSILETAAARGVTLIITKTQTVMDGSLNAQIQAAAFSMASMIEVEFTRARTREGLERARLAGRIGGRRKGSTGRLKLDPQRERVGELYQLGLTIPKLARHFDVTEKTMRKFLARHFPKNGSAS